MNLFQYLSMSPSTLDNHYDKSVDKRKLNTRTTKKDEVVYPDGRVAKIKKTLPKDQEDHIRGLYEKFKGATEKQFQSLHIRNAFGYEPNQASYYCSLMVKHGYAQLIGRTEGNKRKPANIYEWI